MARQARSKARPPDATGRRCGLLRSCLHLFPNTPAGEVIPQSRHGGSAMKTENQRAWFFVLPVLLLVAFNALIPIMTVVNYSVQETFGNNVFFWQGLDWFEQILRSDRFHAALGRQFLFTFLILAIGQYYHRFMIVGFAQEAPCCCINRVAQPRTAPSNAVGTN